MVLEKPPRAMAGFTLLELLVVITLLAVLASAALLGYEGIQEQGRDDATRFEMTELRKALINFRRDSGTNSFPTQGQYDCTDASLGGSATDRNSDMAFPTEAGSDHDEIIAWCQHPANFWMLFADPFGRPEADQWNEDTRRGWNGPYLQRKSGFVDVDADFNQDGTFATDTDTLTLNLWGIASPYTTTPFADGDLTWRQNTGGNNHDKFGTPYFLFDLGDEDTARIQSLGANHTYDDAGSADDCLAPLDSTINEPLDSVLCLLR